MHKYRPLCSRRLKTPTVCINLINLSVCVISWLHCRKNEMTLQDRNVTFQWICGFFSVSRILLTNLSSNKYNTMKKLGFVQKLPLEKFVVTVMRLSSVTYFEPLNTPLTCNELADAPFLFTYAFCSRRFSQTRLSLEWARKAPQRRKTTHCYLISITTGFNFR